MPNAKTKAARTVRNPIEAARAHLRETYQKQHSKAKAKVARLEEELYTRSNTVAKASAAYEKALSDLAEARVQLAEIEDALELRDPVEASE